MPTLYDVTSDLQMVLVGLRFSSLSAVFSEFPLGIFRGIYFDSRRPDYMNFALLGNVLGHQISHIFVDGQMANMAASKWAQQKIFNWWSGESLQAYLDIMQCITNQFARFQAQNAESPRVIYMFFGRKILRGVVIQKLMKFCCNFQADASVARHEDVADLAGIKAAYYSYEEKEWRYGPDPLLPGM